MSFRFAVGKTVAAAAEEKKKAVEDAEAKITELESMVQPCSFEAERGQSRDQVSKEEADGAWRATNNMGA